MLTGETEKKQRGKKQGGRGRAGKTHRGAINTAREREREVLGRRIKPQ